jgi:hypothetical protein
MHEILHFVAPPFDPYTAITAKNNLHSILDYRLQSSVPWYCFRAFNQKAIVMKKAQFRHDRPKGYLKLRLSMMRCLGTDVSGEPATLFLEYKSVMLIFASVTVLCDKCFK